MPESGERRPTARHISSIERNLFAALFSFQKRTMDLLRQSSLDDQKLKLAADRIKTVFADTTAEMERSKDLNVTGRLEAAYAEVKQLVDELSGSRDGGKEGCNRLS